MTNLNVVQLPVTVSIKADNLLATNSIQDVYNWAKRHKQQMDAAKALYDEACDMLKLYMGNNETLLSDEGALLATYKQQAERRELDKDALKLNFADIYDICLVTKPGNRPFCLK